MNWLIYLVQVNIYLLAFYAFYRLVLANETFFSMNRLYLVSSAVISFMIPVLQSEWVNSLLITQQAKQVAASINITDYYLIPVVVSETNPITLYDILTWVYISGLALFILRLCYKFYSLKKLISAEEKSEQAFSFFGYISVGKSHERVDTIEKHEQVHARQLHSADVLFFELLTAINWFNPVVYLYKKAIRNIHEYIADSNASANEQDKSAYALLLVSQTFGIDANQLTNNFFNSSLLKQRIAMLHKSRSKKIALLKYGLSAPLFIGLLILSSAFVNDKSQETVNAIAPTTVLHFDADKQVPFSFSADTTPKTPKIDVIRFPPAKIVEGQILNPSVNITVTGQYHFVPSEVVKGRALSLTEATPATIQGQIYSTNVANSLFASTQSVNDPPLIVINGKVTPYGLGHVDADDIVTINVIKKDAAHGKYGDKGKNGAVEITTKPDAVLKPVTVRGYAIPAKVGQTNEKSGEGFQPEKVVTGYPTNVTLNAAQDDILNFASVDIIPEFPGGMRKFYEYVAQNYNYPATARAQNVSGRVTLSFIVEKDGDLSSIKVLKDLGYGTGEEAVRLLQNSPKWSPGIQNGKSVRVAYTLPITLNLGKK